MSLLIGNLAGGKVNFILKSFKSLTKREEKKRVVQIIIKIVLFIFSNNKSITTEIFTYHI